MNVDTIVPFSGSFKNHYVENIMIKQIVDEIKLIPNYHVLKSDIDLIIRICLVIEQVFYKHKLKKKNKKDVFFNCYCQLFTNVSDLDKQYIGSIIDKLHEDGKFEIKINGKIIKYAREVYKFFFYQTRTKTK